MIFKHINASGVVNEKLSLDADDTSYISVRDNNVVYVSGVTESSITGGSGTGTIADGSLSLGKLAPITGDRLVMSNSGGTITQRSIGDAIGLVYNADGPNYGILINDDGVLSFPQFMSISDVLDLTLSSTHGDIIYRGGSGWTYLAPGSSGSLLMTRGTGVNPSWVPASSIYDQYIPKPSGSVYTIGTPQFKQMVSASSLFTVVGTNPFSELDMNVDSDSLYEVEFNLIISCDKNTLGARIRIDVTSTTSFFGQIEGNMGANGGTTSSVTYLLSSNGASATLANAPGNAANTKGLYRAYAIFHTSASGIVNVRLGTENTGGVTAVHSPSNVRLTKLN